MSRIVFKIHFKLIYSHFWVREISRRLSNQLINDSKIVMKIYQFYRK